MWTSQVYEHHDKMARTKTHRTSQKTEYTKTQQTLRNTYFLCFSDFSVLLFSIFNYLKDFSKKCWITALVRSMKNIGGLNQFFAAANLTPSQHFLDKNQKKCPFTLFNKVNKELKKTTGKWKNTKSKIKNGWKRENP